MNSASNVTVEISPIELFREYLAHQPPILGIILAYAAICIFMYWITRSKGYLISFLSSWLYLVPLWVH